MKVAEIQITEGSFMSAGPALYVIGFDDLAAAYAEYERLVELMRRKEERANDLPKLIECEGPANKVSLPLDGVRAVALADFAKINEQRKGVRDAFPLAIGP